MHTPVLFTNFNRPEKTRRVLEALAHAKPSKIYISIDGPRPGNNNDVKNRQEVIEIIKSGVNWECSVYYSISEKNKGCKIAMSEAIDWFFQHEERGIILEDDVVPNKSFFVFCEAMLEKYNNREDIFHISGSCYLPYREGGPSHHLSYYPFIWGWATWRRAWQHYDVTMADFNTIDKTKLYHNLSLREKRYWSHIFAITYAGKVDTWDYQWTYCVLKNNALCINSNINAIENIGFDAQGTHTLSYNSRLANNPSYVIEIKEMGELKKLDVPKIRQSFKEYYLSQQKGISLWDKIIFKFRKFISHGQ